MMARSATLIFCMLLAAVGVAGCLGGTPTAEDQSSVGPGSSDVKGARAPASAAGPGISNPTPSGPLTNESWDLAAQDAERYRGTEVTITGEVFNVLSDSEGFHRFQIYTEPATRKGNTHVAIKEDPRIKKGYQVRVTGTLRGLRVARAVSGRELKVPEVEAKSVEIIGPPSVVTPTITPSPTKEPTATKAPTDIPTSVPLTRTPAQAGRPSPTARPATNTPPPTPLPTLEEPALATVEPTVAEVSPTETAEPTATSTAVPTPTVSPAPTALPTRSAPPVVTMTRPSDTLPLSIQAASAELSGPMSIGQDAGASGRRYIYSGESDRGWSGEGAPPPTGEATLRINLPREGSYTVWSRMWYGHVDANSYWLIVDNGRAIKVGNEDGGYRTWKWVNWRDDSPANRIVLELSAGPHTLRLVGREAGTRISEVIITDDPDYEPQ